MYEVLKIFGEIVILGTVGLAVSLLLTIAVFVLVLAITTAIDTFRAFRRGMTLQQYYDTFERNQLP